MYHLVIHIILNFRTTIESSYGQQVAQLREQYTQEDKELIKEVLEAKCAMTSSQESESPVLPQKIMIEEDLEETIIRKFKGAPARKLYYHYVMKPYRMRLECNQ